METNETHDPITPGQDLVLNSDAQSYLREAGKWAVFLGILGFIFTGLILLAAFFVGALFAFISKYQSGQSPFPAEMPPPGVGVALGFVYILVAVFYFFFSYYLYQFGSRIKRGILFNDAVEVSKAAGKLKSFFKLWGITTIVILAFYALIIIIFILIGISTSSMMSK